MGVARSMKLLCHLAAFAALGGSALVAVEAPAAAPKVTHLAFVVDTTGSMRNPRTRALWSAAVAALEEMAAAHPKLKFCQMFDAGGRPLLGSRDQWLACDNESVEKMKRALARSLADGTSDPMGGLTHALTLPLPEGMDDRIHICVIGDEFTGTPRVALRALERSNPDDGTGRRRAIISGVQVPTMKGSPTATRAAFEELMNEAAKRSGGTFNVLPGTN
jgi:hypothetical protein